MENNDVKSISPVPPKPTKDTMTYLFWDAIKEVMNGRKITKVEWKNPAIYGCIADGVLVIHLADGLNHPWTLSEADMIGDDWVILNE